MPNIQTRPSLHRDEFLRTLNSLDFGPLVYKLMHAEDRPGLTLEQALDAVQKYKGFLFLYAMNPEQSLSPSRYIDYVWHAHILDTELYVTHTLALFGHYLHHFPFFGTRGELDQKQLLSAAEFTRGRAAKEFGWDDDDWCGTGRHPKWPRPHRSYVADLAAVLYPAGALSQQLAEDREQITIEAGSFRQTIEHMGPADGDMLNVGAPPAGAGPTRVRSLELARRPDVLTLAIGALKLPKWVTVCKPRVDFGTDAFKVGTLTELLEREKMLAGQRLRPEGYTTERVQLDVLAGG